MATWAVERTLDYLRDFRTFEKKRPNELSAVLNNLDAYVVALQSCNNPHHIKIGFLHTEPMGIKAIDQKGGSKRTKLMETRLYLYPDVNSQTLYLLAIGGKKRQGDDIALCKKIVKEIRRGDDGTTI